MCAVCGCLTSGKPAPRDGSYVCVEYQGTDQEQIVEMKEGEALPECPETGEVHWKLAT